MKIQTTLMMAGRFSVIRHMPPSSDNTLLW